MKVEQKSYLTPLAHTVSSVLQNPLKAISSAFLIVSALLLSLLDFKLGLFLLPIIVLEIVSVSVLGQKAKHQAGRFGLAAFNTLTFVCLILSLALVGFLALSNTEFKIILPNIFNVSFADSALPLSLINTGFDGALWFSVGLSLVFLSKLAFGCSLLKNLKTNLPKKSAILISLVLNLVAFALFTVCTFDRLRITSLLILAKGLGAVVEYTCSAVFILSAVSSILLFVLNIYTFTKMRKNNHAF